MRPEVLDYILKKQAQDAEGQFGDAITKSFMQAGNAYAGVKAPDTSVIDQGADARQARSDTVTKYIMAKQQADDAAALAAQKAAEDRAWKEGEAQKNRDATRENAKDRNALMGAIAGMKQNQFDESESRRKKGLVQSIGKQIRSEQLDIIEPGLQKIEGIVSKYDGKDLPGAGVVDSFLANVSGNRLGSEDGQVMRQEAKKLGNMLLKSRSGAAVTDQEYRRFLEEVGSGAVMSENRFKQGLEMMRRDLDNIKQTVRNEAPDEYDQIMAGRGGVPQAAASFPRQVRNSKGQVATVKNQAELDEARQEGFQ